MEDVKLSDCTVTFFFAHLRHRFLYIEHDETDVVGEDSVQRRPPFTVLPQHKKTNILLC